MNEVIRRDILTVLRKLTKILKVKDDTDTSEMKYLSNRVIHNASIFQDEDSVSIAILVYALSKIIDRSQGKYDYSIVLNSINKLVKNLENKDGDKFRVGIKLLLEKIANVDHKLKFYIQEVINQAQIRKGCKICAHGISVERASSILGVSQWELMEYLGQTSIMDKFVEPVSVKTRMRYARKLFK
tara:strand:+ start:9810 stop:10364 length:555 start_codon:yes stop_codon:yes gene_type:complete